MSTVAIPVEWGATVGVALAAVMKALWETAKGVSTATIARLETELRESKRDVQTVVEKLETERVSHARDNERVALALALRSTPAEIAAFDDLEDMPTAVRTRMRVAKNAVTSPPARPDGRHSLVFDAEKTPEQVLLGPHRPRMPSTRG